MSGGCKIAAATSKATSDDLAVAGVEVEHPVAGSHMNRKLTLTLAITLQW